MAEEEKLNERQTMYVEGLIAGKSLIQAYRDAGYEDTEYTYSCASRLYRNAKIIEALNERRLAQKAAVDTRIHEMGDGASNVYIRILKLDSKDPQIMKIQKETAKDVFEMMGLKPSNKHELSGEVSHVVQLKDVIKEVGLRNGKSTERGNDG